jgi:hypothetical protein
MKHYNLLAALTCQPAKPAALSPLLASCCVGSLRYVLDVFKYTSGRSAPPPCTSLK